MSSSASRTRRPVAGERARTRPATGQAVPRTESARPARRSAVRGGPDHPSTEPLPVGDEVADGAPPASRGWKLRRRHTGTSERTTTGRRPWIAPAVALVAVLVVLGGLVGVTGRDPGAQARTDRAATSQARTSIEQMLSYNYKTIDAQAAQIEGLLTGSFKNEFSSAMDEDIKPLAVKNQTVVQAKVSDIGVMSSSGTTVRVLAFVNQARVGTDQKEPVVDQNRVMATMSKVGERWLVSKVEAF